MQEKREQGSIQILHYAFDALRYAEAFGTTRQNAYQRMKEAEDSLFNRRFSHDEDGKTRQKSLDTTGKISR